MADAAPPASLVALRDRRDAAIQRLSDSFVADLLAVEQFEERLARVHAATTVAEVDLVLADLTPLLSGASTTALSTLTVSPGLPAATRRIRSILGNVERRGGWTVPAQLQVTATFGNVELDFTNARFTSGVTEIDAHVVFGNLEISVPPQLAVECEGSSVLGNFENHGNGAVADPDRPLLRVKGYAVLGNVEIHTRLPGASAGADHGRQLASEGQGKLGPVRER